MKIRQFDRWAAGIVERLPASFQQPLRVLSKLTHPSLLGVLLMGAILVTWYVGDDFLWLVLLGSLLLLPFEQLLKVMFRRKRPPTMYVDNMRFHSYSFPSGHAYASGLMAAVAWLVGLYYIGGGVGLLFASFVTVGTIAIGVSRIYLGAHFPSDVIAGWLLGGLFGTILIWFLQIIFIG